MSDDFGEIPGLKLCLALAIFYPTFGGGSLRFMRYQPGLRKRSVEARVLAGTARTKDAFHEPGQDNRALGWDRYPLGQMIPTDHVEGMPVHRVRLPDETGVRRTSTFFRSLLLLCRTPETRPDLIQLHSFERFESLFWLQRLRRERIPLVYAIQIARPITHPSKFIRRLKTWMVRTFYNSFDGVVTSSEQISGYLRNIGVEVPIAVIPNGVDLTLYRPHSEAERLAARASLGVQGDGPLILSVGAISPRKGSDLLVEAWTQVLEQFPDAELALVGPRHDRNSKDLDAFSARLEQLIADSPHPDRVHLPGVRDDLDQVYAAADLVVLPTAREGGTPNVVLEAMASARPVLLTPFEGQSNAIGRPDIEFAECEREPKSIAEGIMRLLSKTDERETFIARGRDWVARYLDLEQTLDRFTDFYQRAATFDLDAQQIELENPKFPSVFSAKRPTSD
ncbi:MAG: glycosyltransferase family 4 protein [Myxococcota bacterium]